MMTEVAKATRPTRMLGVPGYVITGGQLMPKERDRKLIGAEKYRVFSEHLSNVSIIACGVRYYLDLISGASWNFEPADDSSQAEEVADFAEDVMNGMESSLGRITRRAAMYKFYGFSIQEWTLASRDDGRIGLLDMAPRPQSTIWGWLPDEQDLGKIANVLQLNPATGAIIKLPVDKLLYVTDDTLSDSPEGLGLFRHMVKTADGLMRFEELEHVNFETDLQGIPIARVPLEAVRKSVEVGNMTEAEAARVIALANDFLTNHIRGKNSGLMLESAPYFTTDDRQSPSTTYQYDVELLKSGGTSFAQVDVAIKRKTLELARLLGIEAILNSGSGGGSYSLDVNATKRLFSMVNSTLWEIGDAYDKQIIRKVMFLNGIPKKLWPKARPQEIAFRSVEEITGALSSMAQAGATLLPDDPAIGEVRDLIGLSRPEPMDPALAEMLALGSIRVDEQIQDPNGLASTPSTRALPVPKDQTQKSRLGLSLRALKEYLDGEVVEVV